jgi:hypothetical protein
MWSMTDEQLAKDDLFYGQVVIIVARWFLIFGGIVLALWSADTTSSLIVPVTSLILLMALNFYLHGRYLRRQPVNAAFIYVTSAIDLIAVALIMVSWTQGRGAGLASPYFIFFYPILLAFALVFRPRLTAIFATTAIGLYLSIVLLGSGIGDVDAAKVLLQRLATFTATAGLGTYFWRVRRHQRQPAREVGPGAERGHVPTLFRG